MIIDRLDNAPRYYSIHPKIAFALKYLAEQQPLMKEETEPRVSEVVAEGISFKTIFCDTVPHDRRWESHIEKTDLQYVIRGMERIGFAPVSEMQDPVRTEGKDQIIWQGNGDKILVPEGFFIILFPGEAHMSKLAAGDKAEHLQKASFKIDLNF